MMQIKPEDISISEYVVKRSWISCKFGISILHKPTGIESKYDEARSSHRNEQLAFEKLQRLLDMHYKRIENK